MSMTAAKYFAEYDAIPLQDRTPRGDDDFFFFRFRPHDALGVDYACYNSEIDEDIISVMRGVKAGKFNVDLAEETGLTRPHVELIQAILIGSGLCSYGTSPRGAFVDFDQTANFDRLLAYWERLREVDWDVEKAGIA